MNEQKIESLWEDKKYGNGELLALACHGAGRAMSRHAAKRQVSGEKLKRELEKKKKF